jgi:cytochrome c oxidase subunit 3
MSETVSITQDAWEEPDRDLTAQLGMWVFLASEILFFGAIFCAYTVLRYLHPAGFVQGGHETDILYGGINTAILITSAATMTVAAKAADFDDLALVRIGLGITFALGVAFLGVKGLEYADDISKHLVPGRHFRLHDPAAAIFWGFYWVLTGLHAIHMSVGLGVLARAYWLTGRGLPADRLRRNLDVASLYWHLVDAIWIVIFPVLYLAGRAG